MKKCSLMYSAGLDSFIAWHFLRNEGYDVIPIYVNMGHPYAEKELAAIHNIGDSELSDALITINMKELYPAIVKRLSNQIIPSRNVMLATIGSMFSPKVCLGVLDGEQNGKEHDKSERFFEDTSKLLTFTNEFFQPTTIIESPFAKMTKGDTIKWALEHGIPKEILFKTSSCYDDNEQKCSVCLTCVKRYLAFLESGIVEPGYHTDPLKSAYFAELMREIPLAVQNNDYSRFTKGRAEKFMALINSDLFKSLAHK